MCDVRVVTYSRVSTRDQGDSGLGLAAQHSAITQALTLHAEWELIESFQDVASGKSTRRRPGLEAACRRLRAGEADILLVAKLDRLSRSVFDFAKLLERAQQEHWAVVALDVAVDTTTATGEMIANMVMVFAQWERRVISERTTAALHEAERRGQKLGRPKREIAGAVKLVAVALADEGKSLREIAAALPEPAPGGGTWSATAVRRVILAERKRAAWYSQHTSRTEEH